MAWVVSWKMHVQCNFDYLYTNPLKRAVQTAEVIAPNKEIKPIIMNELKKINFGEWESLTIK